MLTFVCFFLKFLDWSFVESFYFVMMTFTTVGFGDYHVTKSLRKRIGSAGNCSNSVSTNGCLRVPTQQGMNWHQGYYIVLSMVYILCGLILTGSAINFLIVHCMVPKREEVTVSSGDKFRVRGRQTV